MKPPAPSQPILWALLALPAVVVVARQLTGAIPYGAALQESGEWAVRLLLLTLAVLGVVTLALLMLLTARIDWKTFFIKRPPPIPLATK